jgi:histidyl-tRNA synthetase
METKAKKLSLEPYKGTRDFYPEDQFAQNYIFRIWRKVAESYGYLEYGASILEETDLYRAKSGEEIVNEQTYSFTDRGGRDVTIRPEMTPTVARMVAQKRRELTFPLRWYSIPNLFRYERPQRGRLREHWQLNCDIFGVDSIEADVEVISLAYDMMKAFGAKDENFQIKINSRKFLNYLADDYLQISAEQKHKTFKLIDRMNKISAEEFEIQGIEILNEKFDKLKKVISSKDPSDIPGDSNTTTGVSDILNLITSLKRKGIVNVVFDPTIMRGFDYYTGTVFEMYDTNPKNPRALFGGGRYDDLVGIFGVEKVSGIGFGWGDVTTRDFLETYNLLPQYHPPVQLYIAHLEGFMEEANKLADYLRKQGANVEVDLTDRQVSKQIKTADREKIPFVLAVGEDEVKTGKFKVKNLAKSTELEIAREDLSEFIKLNI